VHVDTCLAYGVWVADDSDGGPSGDLEGVDRARLATPSESQVVKGSATDAVLNELQRVAYDWEAACCRGPWQGGPAGAAGSVLGVRGVRVRILWRLIAPLVMSGVVGGPVALCCPGSLAAVGSVAGALRLASAQFVQIMHCLPVLPSGASTSVPGTYTQR
jgi:hypothetical protein